MIGKYLVESTSDNFKLFHLSSIFIVSYKTFLTLVPKVNIIPCFQNDSNFALIFHPEL